jgi:hypothetical protein
MARGKGSHWILVPNPRWQGRRRGHNHFGTGLLNYRRTNDKLPPLPFTIFFSVEKRESMFLVKVLLY